MKLVDDAKDFWKWHSTHAMTILAALPFAWETIPDDLKASLPESALIWIAVIVGIGGLIGRVRDQ